MICLVSITTCPLHLSYLGRVSDQDIFHLSATPPLIPPHSDHCSTLRLGMDSPRLFVNPGFICGKQELVADVLQHGR